MHKPVSQRNRVTNLLGHPVREVMNSLMSCNMSLPGGGVRPAGDPLGLHEGFGERRLVPHLRRLRRVHHRVLHHLPDRLDLLGEEHCTHI